MGTDCENVIWQSADGTWSRGHSKTPSPTDEEERDLSYDFDEFGWVSCGHPNMSAAKQSWGRTDPGPLHIIKYTPESADEIDDLDDMAAYRCESTMGFHGATKLRAPNRLFRDFKTAELENAVRAMGWKPTTVDVDELEAKYLSRSNNLNDEEAAKIQFERILCRDALSRAVESFDAQRLNEDSFGGRRSLRRKDPATWARMVAGRNQAAITLQKMESEVAVAEALSRPPAPNRAGIGRREKETGVPTVNGGRFAQGRRAEPSQHLDPYL